MIELLGWLLLLPVAVLVAGVLVRAFYRPKRIPTAWRSAQEWDAITAERIAAEDRSKEQTA